MPQPTIIAALALTLLLLTACPPLEDDSGGGGGGDEVTSEHPCFGNRTDALLADDAQTFWVGCGSTTIGTGLYLSRDGGSTWEAPTTDPPGALESFRVSSLQRAADGLLYVGGIQTTGSGRVVSVNTATSPMSVEAVFISQSQTWNSFHVGTFRHLPSGMQVAESLTGFDLAWRASPESEWQDGYGWWGEYDSVQILDMVEHGGLLYGAGSTIIQPPHAFLPMRDSADFALEPVALSETIMGELWGIDVDDAGIVVGGVDQDRNVGVIFVSGADPWVTADWTTIDVGPLADDSPTWIRGVCRDGDQILAVGEYSMGNDALVLHSSDGGSTFADITPVGAPALHKCTFLPAGGYAIAGAEGTFIRSGE